MDYKGHSLTSLAIFYNKHTFLSQLEKIQFSSVHLTANTGYPVKKEFLITFRKQ